MRIFLGGGGGGGGGGGKVEVDCDYVRTENNIAVRGS